MQDLHRQGASPSREQASYAVVVQPDGSCFVRAYGFHARTVIIGVFANEILARAWTGLVNTIDLYHG
jgi:hypothetical protein